MKIKATFPVLLQGFFTDRLMRKEKASPNTITSHRDTFRLLLSFSQERLKKAPSEVTMEDLNAPFIGEFLDHLEKDRGNVARTRNTRLSSIRSFFKYVAYEEPSLSGLVQRVLAMPKKRFKRKSIEYFTRPEMDAILEAPDQSTQMGRRDRTLLLLGMQTGLRVSELISLRREDVVLGVGAHVRCTGKGRKERCTPLRKETAASLRAWLRERENDPSEVLFLNARGKKLSRDGVKYILNKHAAAASQRCNTLATKKISPHVMRHSTAMDLLDHGVDISVIALWLGHESVETVQVYLHAHMKRKEQALEKTEPFKGGVKRFRPDDDLLEFLKGL
jgi:site-specific recombinase XerD